MIVNMGWGYLNLVFFINKKIRKVFYHLFSIPIHSMKPHKSHNKSLSIRASSYTN